MVIIMRAAQKLMALFQPAGPSSPRRRLSPPPVARPTPPESLPESLLESLLESPPESPLKSPSAPRLLGGGSSRRGQPPSRRAPPGPFPPAVPPPHAPLYPELLAWRQFRAAGERKLLAKDRWSHARDENTYGDGGVGGTPPLPRSSAAGSSRSATRSAAGCSARRTRAQRKRRPPPRGTA